MCSRQAAVAVGTGIDPFRRGVVRSISDASGEAVEVAGPVPPAWSGSDARSSFFHTHLPAAEALKQAASALGAGAAVNDATFKVKATIDTAAGPVGVTVRLFSDKPSGEVWFALDWCGMVVTVPCCSPRDCWFAVFLCAVGGC